MSNINRVELTGNLTRDPELRYTPDGTAVLRFGVAVNERRRGEDRANFFECVVWGKYGETMQAYLSKGQKVAVAGSLRYSSWEKDGERRSRVEVVAREIDALDHGPGAPRGAKRQPGADDYDENIPF